jgi:hypothetical protein
LLLLLLQDDSWWFRVQCIRSCCCSRQLFICKLTWSHWTAKTLQTYRSRGAGSSSIGSSTHGCCTATAG